MRIKPFALERYFAQHEFSAPYLLSCSDCEPLSLHELLALADHECLRLWESLSLGYTESQGHPLLRAEIAQLYQQITRNDLLVVVPEEGILLTVATLLQPGDGVIVTYPGYQSLYQIAASLGCRVKRWMPRPGDGWHFDVDWIAAQIDAHTRLIVINSPHNPTGAVLSHDDLNSIVEIARRHGLFLLSDEMYRHLEHDPRDRLPSASDVYERAISLAGMSKAYALAGLRLGWLATRDVGLLRQLAAHKDYTTICSSAPSEILALIALRAGGTILERNLNIIHANLRLLDAFFLRHRERLSWTRPRGGSVTFPALRGDGDAAGLGRDLLQTRGVMLLPGDVFGPTYRAHFRIGYGRADLPEALARLEDYLLQMRTHDASD